MTKVICVHPPACSNTNFCVEVSSISTKILNCLSFNLFSESKWETFFALIICWSIPMVNQYCFQVIPLVIYEMTQLHCFNEIFKLFLVTVVCLMQSNVLYVSFVHIKVGIPFWSPIGVSFGLFVPEWVIEFSIIVSSKSSCFNLWILDLIFDNEKLFSSRLFVDRIFCCLKMKEYSQAEGVLVKPGVALESTADLSHKNEVP